jgi:predicted short-subunit dehydrogenase-like oxidoreductase (DUF2520 family)
MNNKISIIGAGNVAHSLVPALIKSGFHIEYIVSKTGHSARELSEAFGISYTTKIEEIQSPLVLITTNDSAIEEVVTQLKSGSEKIIIHTSGSTSIDILTAHHTNAGILYPLQTFTKSKVIDLKEVPLCIEASNKSTLEIIKNIADRISEKVALLNSHQRLKLHAAAVFACNFTNLMYSIGNEILEKEDINFDLLHPLIIETAAKATKYKPDHIQTGPAIRNDNTTIKKHLEILTNSERELYEMLTSVIKNRYFDNDNA